MVQPIKYSVPAYCLSVFATDNKFKAEDVTKRWSYIRQKFLDLGVTVLGFSSDGDTRYLKAMRISSELPLSSDRAHLSQWEWFHIDSMSKDCCYVQDSVHILTKLRTKLTKPSVVLPMGQYFASVSHLYELLSQFSKDKHLLTPSDLKAEDKMNYDAAKRMCSTNVIQLLEKIPNTEGTVVYLKLMNAVITAFIEEDVSVYERLHKSVKVSGTEVGPDDGEIVCVCAWYGVVKTEEKFTLSPTTSPEFFISLKHYKCTLPHTDYEANDDKILLVYKENIINDISRLTNPAPERSCHKDATESDLENANSDKTNLLLPVKSQITPQITNDQEHTSEAGLFCYRRHLQNSCDRLGETTVHNVAYKTSGTIWKGLEPLVMPSPAKETFYRNERVFNRIWVFPYCVATVDGKH
nr:unnamed protein product [Callosobruchus analis]